MLLVKEVGISSGDAASVQDIFTFSQRVYIVVQGKLNPAVSPKQTDSSWSE